jgi:hypothetical protein
LFVKYFLSPHSAVLGQAGEAHVQNAYSTGVEKYYLATITLVQNKSTLATGIHI